LIPLAFRCFFLVLPLKKWYFYRIFFGFPYNFSEILLVLHQNNCRLSHKKMALSIGGSVFLTLGDFCTAFILAAVFISLISM